VSVRRRGSLVVKAEKDAAAGSSNAEQQKARKRLRYDSPTDNCDTGAA